MIAIDWKERPFGRRLNSSSVTLCVNWVLRVSTSGVAVTETAPGDYEVAAPPAPATVAAITAWLAERDLPLAEPDDRTEHVGEATRSLAWPVLVDEPSPECCEWLAELGDESVRDLSHRLRLACELGQVVAVADRALAEA